MSEPLLSADGIARTALDGRTLLDHVSLQVQPGQRWAVAGPTGAGKSLLLRSLALLDPIADGEVRWKGQPVEDRAVPDFRRQVVYLHQRPVLIEGDVETNLRLPFQLQGMRNSSFNIDLVREHFERLQLHTDFLKRRTRDLSGGEAQFTALVRALLVDPIVLLLDEPTAALDAKSAAAVEEFVNGWLKEPAEHRATIWVTHNEQQLGRVADEVLRLEHGCVVESDS